MAGSSALLESAIGVRPEQRLGSIHPHCFGGLEDDPSFFLSALLKTVSLGHIAARRGGFGPGIGLYCYSPDNAKCVWR
jgi:hypothetical protein